MIRVAGGGPAGAMAAALLARAGRRVTVYERDRGPADRLCGEFVSREAQHSLASLGIDAEALGAEPIPAVRLVRGDRVAEARLPFRGLGLSRRAMDAALLGRAEALGATVRRGCAVRAFSAGTLELDGGALETPTLLLATGKHDLRGARRAPAREPEPLIGFKTHLRLAPGPSAALRGHVEVLLFRDGYAGLQRIEGGVANLCLLVRRERFDRLGRRWDALLEDLGRECPHLLRRLDGARALMDRPLSVFRVPYGHVHAPGPADPPGVFRLGDQAAVIPSFCGDGISIALHSGAVAAGVLLRGGDAAAYHRRMRADVLRPVRLASVLYGLGRAAPALVAAACRAMPALMRATAALTRVPDAAVRRGLSPPPPGCVPR